ncbi:uncharacterized protein LOC121694971 [Alosa sapidissima]|uniref:uncharacterized protein LOC121694971 n=1 Tax=Alosa sapidissima TaxID=34773 RepID=UPI001C0929B8|nr:uncharacterized protein LOC121694971 [Alosa sapidissima]
MDLFIILSLLFVGHVTTSVKGYSVEEEFYVRHQYVCPGQSVTFSKSKYYDDLFFEPSGSDSAMQVANRTHILLPSYEFRNRDVFIPEVTRQHEGNYIWTHARTAATFLLRLGTTRLFLKDCGSATEVYYGNKFSLEVPQAASVLEFTREGSTDRKILWSRNNTDNSQGASWNAFNIKYADAGRYAFLKENGVEISSTSLYVRENLEYYDVSKKSFLESKFPVPINEAVVMFIDPSQNEYLLFVHGTKTEKAFQMFQDRLQLQPSQSGELELRIMGLKSRDVGRYEVKDKEEGLVSVISLSEIDGTTGPIATGCVISILIVLMITCCCVWRSRKKRDTAPVSSPSPEYHAPIHVHDPVVIYSPGHPLQPRPTAPVVEEASAAPVESADGQSGQQSLPSSQPLDNNVPLSYNEVIGSGPEPLYTYPSAAPSGASAGGAGGGGADPDPSAPPDPGIQYQPQGWGGSMGDFLTSSPLNMDTNTATSTYNSDKLNF